MHGDEDHACSASTMQFGAASILRMPTVRAAWTAGTIIATKQEQRRDTTVIQPSHPVRVLCETPQPWSPARDSNCICGLVRKTKHFGFLKITIYWRLREPRKVPTNHPRDGPERRANFQANRSLSFDGYPGNRSGRRLIFIYIDHDSPFVDSFFNHFT